MICLRDHDTSSLHQLERVVGSSSLLVLALPVGDFTAVQSFSAFLSQTLDFAINSRAVISFNGEVGGDLPMTNAETSRKDG
jgi:hypothetical protein